MKPTTWIALIFVVAVVAALALTTFHSQPFRCRVCMNFDGRRDCRTASAQTAEGAQRAAITNACAQVASGVNNTIRCENTPPESVDWER